MSQCVSLDKVEKEIKRNIWVTPVGNKLRLVYDETSYGANTIKFEFSNGYNVIYGYLGCI